MNQQRKDGFECELPDDILERSILSLQQERVPPGPPATLIATTRQALSESEKLLPRPIAFVPKTKAMRLIAAATVVVFTVCVATFLVATLRLPSAYAQAIQHIRDAHAMSYIELVTLKDRNHTYRNKVFLLEDGRRRIEHLTSRSGVVSILDDWGIHRLILRENTKTATVFEPVEEFGSGPSKLQSWIRDFQELDDKPDKELGPKELEGKRVTGFVATRDNQAYTMWVDQVTALPVLIEIEGPHQRTVMSDFKFYEEFDESLFSFDVPAGYRVVERHPSPQPEG